MSIRDIVVRKKDVIVGKWLGALLKSYPADSAYFMKSKKDAFANPIGDSFDQNTAALFDALFSDWSREEIASYLDPIIRVRAIQNFTPYNALAFIFSLKHIIREHVKKELAIQGNLEELFEIESRIDDMCGVAFDIYMACREKIYDLKANEEKTKVFRAFKRAGLITEISDDDVRDS